ncbi:pyrroline-5-carboxylate reductase family protein, partial [Mesorhizobium sp. P5_C1]
MSLVETLFAALGTTHLVASEALLDKATAIAGSGPAYVFYFVECLTRAATELGIDPLLARDLSNEM